MLLFYAVKIKQMQIHKSVYFQKLTELTKEKEDEVSSSS